jgi:hypothetical protein
VLAGAAGHGYGHNSICVLHDAAHPEVALRDYSFPIISPTIGWVEAMDSAGAFGIGHLRKLMELLPWYEMVPDQSIVTAGQGEGEDHGQSARGETGRFAIAYLPFGNPVSVQLTSLAADSVQARWYSPRDGTFTPIATYPREGARRFTAPSSGRGNDWVLVLGVPD